MSELLKSSRPYDIRESYDGHNTQDVVNRINNI